MTGHLKTLAKKPKNPYGFGFVWQCNLWLIILFIDRKVLQWL